MLTPPVRDQLHDGRIALDAPVSGLKNWQQLFGKMTETGAWLWGDLRRDWPFVDAYEYLIARMMIDAFEGKEPAGTILRAPTHEEFYRMTLRRFEQVSGDRYRFHFTAGRVDQPFEVAKYEGAMRETVLYHLVNLTWYFRRRIIDKLYGRILQVLSMPHRNAAEVANLYDDLGRELMLVKAQSIMRRVDNLYDPAAGLRRRPARRRDAWRGSKASPTCRTASSGR